MKQHSEPWSLRWLSWVIERLPAHLQQGKMPYVILFGLVMMVIMLVYLAITPYEHARGTFLLAVIASLLVAAYLGMPLPWLVHLSMTAGAGTVTWAIWHSGGIYSPRLAWLLVLPLTPFYTLGRTAGLVWLGIVLSLQATIAWSTWQGVLPVFELSHAHVLHSTLTYALVTVLVMVVPLIYARLNQRTLQISQQHQQEPSMIRELQKQMLRIHEACLLSEPHREGSHAPWRQRPDRALP